MECSKKRKWEGKEEKGKGKDDLPNKVKGRKRSRDKENEKRREEK